MPGSVGAGVARTLRWKPQRESLTSFTADINDEAHFIIAYDQAYPEQFQWRLFIHTRKTKTVFLHGHKNLDTARRAAITYLGPT